MMTYPTNVGGHQTHTPEATIATIAFGPCWCRSVPGNDGSFDVFRQRSVQAPLERNTLIVSNRVPSSGVAMVRRRFDSLSNPLVIATQACPSAEWYWERSPADWVEVGELVDIHHRLDACLTGQPELLFSALLAIGSEEADTARLTALTEAI